jgi:hypothetical protein
MQLQFVLNTDETNDYPSFDPLTFEFFSANFDR